VIRKEIPEFLKIEITRDTTEFEENSCYEFMSKLAFLTDIISHLNELNLNLQDKNQNIADLFEHVHEFRIKLELLKGQIEKKLIFLVVLKNKQNIQMQISLISIKTLLTLLHNFNTRFADFKLLKLDIDLFFSPLTVKISEKKLELQLKLDDLQHDIHFASIKETGEYFFKLLPTNRFPKLILD